MAHTAQYKPSPLSYGSPRASPFRRPESPASPSPLRNSTTPTPSPTKTVVSPSKLQHQQSPLSIRDEDSWTPRGLTPARREPAPSPTRISNHHQRQSSTMAAARATGDVNALSKLQPAQVRELREGFQILDRDSDGVVGREDVADMLHQLGLPSSNPDIAPFFPPSGPQTMTMATFLTTISSLLSSLSPSSELLSAFGAFDDDDSGQNDLAELRDALLQTAPEPGDSAVTEREIDKIMSGFSGRRAFGKSNMGRPLGKKGEVFKYQEFVGVITGNSGNGKGTKEIED